MASAAPRRIRLFPQILWGSLFLGAIGWAMASIHSRGCSPDEMAITRNASEALQIAQLGIDLKAGDEVVITNQNYGRMITTWEQRARRDGIVVKV